MTLSPEYTVTGPVLSGVHSHPRDMWLLSNSSTTLGMQ